MRFPEAEPACENSVRRGEDWALPAKNEFVSFTFIMEFFTRWNKFFTNF